MAINCKTKHLNDNTNVNESFLQSSSIAKNVSTFLFIIHHIGTNFIRATKTQFCG